MSQKLNDHEAVTLFKKPSFFRSRADGHSVTEKLMSLQRVETISHQKCLIEAHSRERERGGGVKILSKKVKEREKGRERDGLLFYILSGSVSLLLGNNCAGHGGVGDEK